MAIDWTGIYQQYKGKWVTLQDDEVTVITSGRTAQEAWEKAQALGHAHPILSRIPKELVTYIGAGL